MAIPGSATYKATALSEGLATRSTAPSAQSVPPEAIHGPDWVAQDPRSVTFTVADPHAKTSSLGMVAMQAAPELAPVIAELTPDSASVPGPDFDLVVRGENFSEESVINWNGGDEPTEFVSAEELRTLVKPSTVQTPLPFTLPVCVKTGQLSSGILSFTFAEAEPEAAKSRHEISKAGHEISKAGHEISKAGDEKPPHVKVQPKHRR